jgi:filamentous hemagglutinin family protein
MTKAFSFSTSLFLTFFLWFVSFNISANPEDGKVISGNINIQQESPTKLGITQTTEKGIINWQKFNINPNEHTQFYQPSNDAVTLNRVVSDEPSKILGNLSANGKVFIINQNGILFGANSKVDVAGLVASVHDIKNSDFLDGKLNFSIPGRPDASVINEGNINIKDQGLAAFVAPSVQNSGNIVAKLGKVALASGNGFTLDLYGDDLITLVVSDKIAKTAFNMDGKQLESFVDNSGTIQANGGYVVLTAKVARDVVNSVVNNSGIIETQSVYEKDGKIILSGGDSGVVKVTGSLDASSQTGKGGYIEVTGEKVGLFSGAKLDASGKTGGGTILVGGDYLGGKASDETYKQLGIKKEDKAIHTAQAVAIAQNTLIKSDALESGIGGKVVVWSDDTTRAYGKISSTGVDKGGFIEVSGKKKLDINGLDVEAENGTVLFDPGDVHIVSPTSGVFVDVDVTDFTSSQPPGGRTNISSSTIEKVLNKGTNVVIRGTPEGPNVDSAGDIFVEDSIIKTSGRDAMLSLFSADSISLLSGVEIASKSGKLDVYFDSDYDRHSAGLIDLQEGSAIRTNGGFANLNYSDRRGTGIVDTSNGVEEGAIREAHDYFQRSDFSFLKPTTSEILFTTRSHSTALPILVSTRSHSQELTTTLPALSKSVAVLPKEVLVSSNSWFISKDALNGENGKEYTGGEGTTNPEKTGNLIPKNEYTIYDAYEEKGFIPDFSTPEILAKKLDLFGTTDLAKLELDPRWTAYPKDFREKAYRIASPTFIRAVTPEDTAIWSKNEKFQDVIKDGVIDSNERVDLILSSDANESDKNAMLISYGLQELGNVYIGRLGKTSSNTTGISKTTPKIVKVESKVDNGVDKNTIKEDDLSLLDKKAESHTLDGDKTGGGHRFGIGNPGKTEFPENWSDQKIKNTISDIATDPKAIWSNPDPKGYITTTVTKEGLDIKVVFDITNKRIVSGYPTNTPKNPKP